MGAKLRIQKMQALAKQRDGKCLSITYVNVKTKLCWRCAKGHEWDWCSTCGGSERLTLEQMQRLAQQRGGNGVDRNPSCCIPFMRPVRSPSI